MRGTAGAPNGPEGPTGSGRANTQDGELGILARRWTLELLRDIALIERPTYSMLLRHNVGLGSRMLSRRLRSLAAEGFIEHVDPDRATPGGFYRLTELGEKASRIACTALHLLSPSSPANGPALPAEAFSYRTSGAPVALAALTPGTPSRSPGADGRRTPPPRDGANRTGATPRAPARRRVPSR